MTGEETLECFLKNCVTPKARLHDAMSRRIIHVRCDLWTNDSFSRPFECFEAKSSINRLCPRGKNSLLILWKRYRYAFDMTQRDVNGITAFSSREHRVRAFQRAENIRFWFIFKRHARVRALRTETTRRPSLRSSCQSSQINLERRKSKTLYPLQHTHTLSVRATFRPSGPENFINPLSLYSDTGE